MDEKFENIIVSTIENTPSLNVGLIEINRPKAKNALNTATMTEIVSVLESFDKDNSIGCTVITGNKDAFSAGADIKEMAEANSTDMYIRDQFAVWDKLRNIKKPFIAAASGYTLGGGFELALACDILVASDTAKFAFPEVTLGVIPGAGGTQRLTHAIGKGKAMEMILSGKFMPAKEMFDAGLVTILTSEENYLNDSLELAKKIASYPSIAIQLGKESVLKALDLTVKEGIEFERKNFYLLFSTEDKAEGMKAFIEKRKPEWKHK